MCNGSCSNHSCNSEHIIKKTDLSQSETVRLETLLDSGHSNSTDNTLIPLDALQIPTFPLSGTTSEDSTPPHSPFHFMALDIYSLHQEKPGDILCATYQLIRKIGNGSHSTVWQAKQLSTGRTVAIKQSNIHKGGQLLKRTYREIKLLQHFCSYEGTVSIDDFLTNNTKDNFKSVFIVLEYCETDLHNFLSYTAINFEMVKNFSYQLVCALKVLHEANVIHRDLKPQNILISCTDNKYILKLCDFGTVRPELTKIKDLRQTTLVDVTTVYYLAPEGLLNKECYSNSVDIWALGCILAELVKRSPLLRGNGSSKDQLRLILGICGKPLPEELDTFPDSPEKEYLLKKPDVVMFTLEDMLPGVDSALLEFIKLFLVFMPEKRISALLALKHPFLSTFSCKYPNEIPPFVSNIDLDKLSDEKYKELLWDEIMFYKNKEKK
jgi:mitogen-activated protein kinase 1/3